MNHKIEKVLIVTSSKALEKELRTLIPSVLAEVHVSSEVPVNMEVFDLAFIDASQKNLEETCKNLSYKSSHLVLVCSEKDCSENVPDLVAEGFVDDLLLTPLRKMEVLGKLNHAAYLHRVRELDGVNASLRDMISKFEEDLKTARSIQKNLIPEKFPPLHGLKVSHRYISGFKSGGDYLDFFEFEDKNHVGILMTDSSGYGLSSALMSVVLRLTMKLTRDEARSPSLTVKQIFEELKLTMKPKDHFSIFFGVLNRKTFELRYSGCGSIGMVHLQKSKDLTPEMKKLFSQALTPEEKPDLSDLSIKLSPEDRLVLFSDGFVDAFQDIKKVEKVIQSHAKEEPQALISDFTYQVKGKLDPEDMPDQDCSVMVIDVDKKVLRIA